MSSPLPPEGMILRKALRIRQAENAIARSVGRIFGQAFQGLTDLIRGQPFDAVTPGRQARRLASVIRQGDDILADAYRTIRSSVKAQLTDLSQYAGKSAVDEVLASLRTRGVSLSPLSVPTRAEFAAIVTHNPVYGAPLSDWWRQFEGNSRYRLHRELQLGMTRRESVDALVRRISGTRWDRPEGVHRIARQEADTVVRTAVSEVQNAAHLLSYHRNSDVVEGVEWLSTLDDRTCFVGSTRVLTPNGERPIRDLVTGDAVISRGGERQLLDTMARPHHGPLVALETSADRVVIATPDHRVWVRGVGWKHLAALTPGDALESPDDQPVYVRGLLQFSLAEAHHGQPGVLEYRGLSGIPFRVGVPVGPVDFNRDRQVGQEEVYEIPSNPGFLDEVHTGHFQRDADEDFEARLSPVAPIALLTTETVRGARPLPTLSTAVEAGEGDNRPSAQFRAMDSSAVLPVARSRGSDRLATPGAGGVGGGFSATRDRTVLVPIDVAARDRERLATRDADLVNKGSVRRVVARAGAVGLFALAGDGERDATMLADLGFGANPAEMVALSPAEHGTSRPGWAVELLATLTALTSERHFAQFSEIVDEYLTCGNIMVYDLTVQADHAFFAGGVLAHNCGECGNRDGDRWALDDPDLLKPPEHPRCRCRLIPVVLGVPMRPRVTWEQWITDQPLTTQERVFGKRRAALVRDGTAVADLIREDGTFIPVRNL